MKHPTTFISYTWENDEHKGWVKNLAIQLRQYGIDVKLDQWEVVPGDQMPYFMEQSVRENDFVLIICTPNYNLKSEKRIGGVGYEGDIMTAEVLQNANHRKFIPILKSGTKETSIPSWLKGKYYIDLSSELLFEKNFVDLKTTLLNEREIAPNLGTGEIKAIYPTSIFKLDETVREKEEVRIKGILIDEVSLPKNNGTIGSALYKVPFELNLRPDYNWIDLFINAWDRPTRFSTMHRPGIASVQGNKIILDGTTIEEVEKYHKDTLKLAVEAANSVIRQIKQKKREFEENEKKREEEHKNAIEEASKRMKFD